MASHTLFDLLQQNLAARADHPAIVDGSREVTYRQLLEQTESLAGSVAQRGVGGGDRVVVNMQKCIEEIIAMFAVARLGAVFVNVHFQWTVDQLDHVLRDSGAKVLITDARRARALAKYETPATLEHVVVNGSIPHDDRMTSWLDLTLDLQAPPVTCAEMDLAALLYTSGSTGQPKGVMLSHHNLVLSARSAAEHLKNVSDDRLLSLLPFCFDFGLSQLTTMCLVGGTTVLQRVALPAEIVKTLIDQKITGFAAVPPTWVQVVGYLERAPASLPDLRYVANSGDRIPKHILERMPEVFPGIDIYLMYGMTEAFRSTYLRPELFKQKMGSIGRDIPNVKTYIVDETKGICGPGEQGELVHCGPLISMGYWGQPDQTAEKIKPCPHLKHVIGDQKVCYSGDLVRIDEDGQYWFITRKNALIKSRGFRISPTEVEDVVHKSGLVTQVVAFGATDEIQGQAVEIAVTGHDGEPLDEAALLRFCRKHMPAYMVPRAVHLWPGEMPRTGSGKVDRRTIAQHCIQRSPNA
jgi:amino acid adenylation domain-containing protein